MVNRLTSYTGKLLRVDLSTGRIAAEPLDEAWARAYIGGKGLGFRTLLKELPPKTDPLSPQNCLAIFPGPLAGTIVATTSRTAVCTRSPATGAILDSYVGGTFGAMLKYAGWDGLIITGRAPRPVYLHIDNERAELRDAAPVWGRAIWETERWLEAQFAPYRPITLTTGPAGEARVPFANLTSEAYRQAGRGGAGAVFGSKQLKAIAVHGTGGVRVPDMPAFLERYRTYFETKLVTPMNSWTWEVGTQGNPGLTNYKGVLPTRGFTEGSFDGLDGLGLPALMGARVRSRSCFACPLACGKVTRNTRGQRVEGPEYETLALGGSNCGIDDLDAVIDFNRLCDNLGLDTISTGNVIGLAMAMTEQGIHDFGLHFGDQDAYLRAVEEIAARRGVGADLAHGARWLAHRYGGETLAMENKGLEYPGYDPRGGFGMSLAYATSDRGACHMRSFVMAAETLLAEFHPESYAHKAALVIADQNRTAVKWSAIFCEFWPLGYPEMAELLSAATGFSYSAAELPVIGERIWNLGRIFNVREGFGRTADVPPPALFANALRNGPAAGRRPTREAYEIALDEYYTLRGWDRQGRPTLEKLAALGLEEFTALEGLRSYHVSHIQRPPVHRVPDLRTHLFRLPHRGIHPQPGPHPGHHSHPKW